MIKYLKSRTMAFTLISFLISLVLAGIIIAAAGYSPVEAYSAMLGGAFGSTYNLAQTAGTAIPLIFAGLAMAVASKAGIFNIGIEGQILAGALPAALAGTYITGLPAVLHIPVCILVAAIFGGIWAMLAAVIKNKLQISEVIITIMLNYVALYLVEYLVNNPFKSTQASLLPSLPYSCFGSFSTRQSWDMRCGRQGTAHLPRNQPASTTRKTCWQPCSFPAPWQALAAPAKLWAYKVITYPA